MKPILRAPLAVLLLVALPALAQDVQVVTDKQGVQTYTNLPASQRAQRPPAKDQEGVQTYTNVPPGSLRKSRTHHPSQDTAQEKVQAPKDVPASPLQEP